jgi:hypothetical protein
VRARAIVEGSTNQGPMKTKQALYKQKKILAWITPNLGCIEFVSIHVVT